MIDVEDILKTIDQQVSDTAKSIEKNQEELNRKAAEAAAVAHTIETQKRFVEANEDLKRKTATHSHELESLQRQQSTVMEVIQKEETILSRALTNGATLVRKREEAQKAFSRAQEPDIDAYVESALNDTRTDRYDHLIERGIIARNPQRNMLWARMTERKRKHDRKDRMKERHIAKYTAFSDDREKIIVPYKKEHIELEGRINAIESELTAISGDVKKALTGYMNDMGVVDPGKPEEHISIFKESRLTEETMQEETQTRDWTLTEMLEENLDRIVDQLPVIMPIRVYGTSLSLNVLNLRKYLVEIRKVIQDIDPLNIDVKMMEKRLIPLFEKVHPTNKVKVGKYDPDLNERIRKTADYSDEEFMHYTEMIIADPMDDQDLVIDPSEFNELKIIYNMMLPTFGEETFVDMRYAMLRRPAHMTEQIKLMIVNNKHQYKKDMLEMLEEKIRLLGSDDNKKRMEYTEELSRRYLQRFVPKHLKERKESQAQIMEKIAERVYDKKQAEKHKATTEQQTGSPLDKYQHKSILESVDKPELPRLVAISGGKIE